MTILILPSTTLDGTSSRPVTASSFQNCPQTDGVASVSAGPLLHRDEAAPVSILRSGKPQKTLVNVTTGRQIAFSMFTDPELARIGLSDTKIPMAAVLRTRTLSEARGFMKALAAEDDRILGFTAFGVMAERSCVPFRSP